MHASSALKTFIPCHLGEKKSPYFLVSVRNAQIQAVEKYIHEAQVGDKQTNDRRAVHGQ
jgi:hypothetical protein